MIDFLLRFTKPMDAAAETWLAEVERRVNERIAAMSADEFTEMCLQADAEAESLRVYGSFSRDGVIYGRGK